MIPAFIFSDKIQIPNKEINVVDAELFEKAKQELAHNLACHILNGKLTLEFSKDITTIWGEAVVFSKRQWEEFCKEYDIKLD